MEQEILNELETRPLPNEHSCRLRDPGKYKKWARKNCHKKHDGKCIDYVFGILGPDESELQSMRYKTEVWTEAAARAHCKEHDGTFEPAKEEESFAEPERRYMPFTQEMRAFEDGDALIIEGYPIVYDVYASIGWFREIIRPGAAKKVLKHADEFVLWDHESSQPMARRSAGTLIVKEDEAGVFIRADVSKTVWGRNGYESIKNKVTDKMSFAFDMTGGLERWLKEEIEGVKIETREILAFGHLFDYSPVSYPAYITTSVGARMIELALRHRPEPEASGEGGATAPIEVVQAGIKIAQMRVRRIKPYLVGESNE